MRNGIIVLAMAATAFYTGAVWATDLDVDLAKARGTNPIDEGGVGPPHTLDGSDGLAKLLDAYECDNYTKIDANDDWWWVYANEYPPEFKKYPYMIFRFYKPGGYNGGTCHWEIKCAAGANIYVWWWDHENDKWTDDPVSSNDGGSNPGEVTFSVPQRYFSSENIAYFLADTGTYKVSEEYSSISCDRFDIQW